MRKNKKWKRNSKKSMVIFALLIDAEDAVLAADDPWAAAITRD